MDSLKSSFRAEETVENFKGQWRQRKRKRKREVSNEFDISGAGKRSIPFQTCDIICLFAYGYSNQRQYKVPSWTRKKRIPPVKPGDCCRPLEEEVEL